MTPGNRNGAVRLAELIQQGWHVYRRGRWQLVEDSILDRKRGVQTLFFADNMSCPAVFVTNASLPTRTPAEQIAAVHTEERRRRSALLAEVSCIREKVR